MRNLSKTELQVVVTCLDACLEDDNAPGEIIHELIDAFSEELRTNFNVRTLTHSALIIVDEVTAEDISPCDSCGHKFEMGEHLMLVKHKDDDGSDCRCLDCVELS